MHFSVIYYENIDQEEKKTTRGVNSKNNFVTQLTFRKTDGGRNVAYSLKTSRSLNASNLSYIIVNHLKSEKFI